MNEPDKYDKMTNDIIGNCRNAMRSPDASADVWNVVKFYLAAALRMQGAEIAAWRTVTDYARGNGTEGSEPGDLQALIEGQRAEIERLKRGEFICKRCGLRKDGEGEAGEF